MEEIGINRKLENVENQKEEKIKKKGNQKKYKIRIRRKSEKVGNQKKQKI